MTLAGITTGRVVRPRKVLIYGVHGVGKTTFGAMAPSPIFIQTEEGTNDLDVARFPLASSYAEVSDQLASLYTESHKFETLVFDSLDWLEQMIWREVCAKRKVQSVEDIGYAKGYTFALDWWREILQGFTALLSERGMNIILISHARIERFENPETDPYDRYSPKLHKLAAALVQEWCDEVLFANYSVKTRSVGEGFNKKVKGIGTGERILRTTERPSHLAKNRLSMPDTIPLDYEVFAAYVRGESPDQMTEEGEV